MADCKATGTTVTTALAVVAMAAMMVPCGVTTVTATDVEVFADDSADEQLTARPSYYGSDVTATADVHPTGPLSRATGRPVTNIQKVSRTAKAVDAKSAMMAVTAAADNGTGVTGGGDHPSSYPSDLEWLLNVYNPHRWNPVMLPAASMLSVQCRDVMKVYLEALRRGSFWAAKSEFGLTGNHTRELFYARLNVH